jgi:hypothetical protein
MNNRVCHDVCLHESRKREKYSLQEKLWHSLAETEDYHYVACRPISRQQPLNNQLYNSRCSVMALQTTAIPRKWLSSDHMVTPTDTDAIIALQQRNGVFCVVRAKML